MQIISKRLAPVIRDLPSAKLTLTNELLDIDVDYEKEATMVSVTVVKTNGKKQIVIEKQ